MRLGCAKLGGCVCVGFWDKCVVLAKVLHATGVLGAGMCKALQGSLSVTSVVGNV